MFFSILKKTVAAIGLAAVMLPLSSWGGELSPGLQDMTARQAMGKAADHHVDVVVFLEDADLKESIYGLAQASGLSRSQRLRTIVGQLKSFEAPNQRGVLQYLKAHSSGGLVEYWVAPAVKASLPVSRLESLSELNGVKLVVENAFLTCESPVTEQPALSTTTATVSDQLHLLGVPELWQQGLKGNGRLVCSFDTGVDYIHPALVSRWRGAHSSLTSSWFSVVAPDSLPYDPMGHGTHTMGIMVGATEADTFGVAPGAEWITAGIIDQGRTLSMTLADIIDAFQWTLNPDGNDYTTDDVPDVILNSWGIPEGLFVPCDNTFGTVIDHVEAAGIVTVFSAGNEGPDPQTLRSPADLVTTPINSFAVGAVDNNKIIAGFSSRGPSSCDNSEIKPEVVAPGINIRSCYPGGGYVIMSGTSMAAPYLAGLVALIRQYNPDATVAQIKYAFLQAAEDLGPSGEDNTYGHGFVNAARVLEFIPQPASKELEIVGYQVSGDGVANPGETFGLQLTLSSNVDNLSSLSGTIIAENGDGVVILQADADFYFGPGSAIATNATPYEIHFDSALYNGQEIELMLLPYSTALVDADALDFSLTVGIAPNGDIATHANGKIKVSVSDFGQFGFAAGSIYNAAGDGLCFGESRNLLYEAGIIVAIDGSRVASSVRDESGLMKASDFTPVRRLTDEWLGEDGGVHRSAAYLDAMGEVPVTVNQETIHFDDFEDEGMLVIKYRFTNHSAERIRDLRFGFLMDLDLSDRDAVAFDESLALLYQTDDGGMYLGVVALENMPFFTTIVNGTSKTGFTTEQISTLLSTETLAVDDDLTGDVMFVTSSGAFLLDPKQSVQVAVAVVAGQTLGELFDNASRAKEQYNLIASFASGDDHSLPDHLKLYQNYPNPFNPITNISFSVLKAGEVSLDIVNILGQRVKTVFNGYLSTGLHEFEWDATDDYGQRAASGVYFCRLQGTSSTHTRKMLLMK